MSTSMLWRLWARAPRTVMVPARFTALPAQRRPHPGDDRLDRTLILRQRGRALRLEPHHEHRLRVRRTEQPPALRKPDPHAVDVDDVEAFAAEVVANTVGNLELDGVRTVDADLGRAVRRRQIREQVVGRATATREDLE